jgi:homogentisate phytyltransferase/homogentisate geranylgeranyltransferase
LWQFSRPHTIVGSTLSIVALYAIAARDFQPPGALWTLLLPSLLSALACNVYITGLNQWSDVEVDRINKPWLPIPAGRLTRRQALLIVLVSGLLALGMAAWFGPGFFTLILLIMAIGTAYSLPPLKFKRNHLLAAAAISLVRGLLVNLGFYLHFRHRFTGSWDLDPAIWPLTLFVVAFSLGIAWFKDIPDTQGDAAYRFGTLAVKAGRRLAFVAGVAVVSLAYVYVIGAAWWGQLPAPAYFVATHAAALVLFWWQALRLEVHDNRQVKRFYLFFWGLFFLEYILYPLGFYW